MKKAIALVTAFLLLSSCSGCSYLRKFLPEKPEASASSESTSGISEATTADSEVELLRDRLSELPEHLSGIWSSPDGQIFELYSNMAIAVYTPVALKNMDAEEIVQTEIDSVGFLTYTLPDPDSSTDAEIKAYAETLEPGYEAALEIEDQVSDTPQWILFDAEENTLTIDGQTLSKIEDGEPAISSRATGLYLSEANGHPSAAFALIQMNEDYGYFSWATQGERTEGFCRIEEDKVVALIPDAEDITFRRDESKLIETGSQEVRGSMDTYQKISDLDRTSEVNLDLPSEIPGEDNPAYYILPFSSDRLLTYDDISSLSREELILARNELYAKHGRIFKVDWIREYFEAQPWYHGTLTEEEFSSSLFSDIEWQNIMFIKEYETMLDNQ